MKIDPDKFASSYLIGKMSQGASMNAKGALKVYVQAIDAAETFNNQLDADAASELSNNLDIFNKLDF